MGADVGHPKGHGVTDQLSEHADNAAETFNTVNDALMSRIGEVSGGGRSSGSSRSGSGSGSQQRQKAEASA